MKIASFANEPGDLTLRWLNGIAKGPDNRKQVTCLFSKNDGETVFRRLSLGMLPFLMPGLVVSRGEILTARRGGKQGLAVIPDLSAPEIVTVHDALPRRHYDLGGHTGGSHRILRYPSRGWAVLIPEIELIRFLFLHGKVMANAILQPMGLMDLAIAPTPGLYKEILIEFQAGMPHAMTRPEFIKEFAWLAVHPDGRRAWDSVLRLSQGQQSLLLEPPPLKNCRMFFRGVVRNNVWLVLEILALSGRRLPASIIAWTHPSERERGDDAKGGADGKESEGDTAGENRPKQVREELIDDQAESQQDVNQAVILLGGKRGEFETPARVKKVLSPPRSRPGSPGLSEQQGTPRKKRIDEGPPVDPHLPPVIVTEPVSMGETAIADGLPPVEVSVLEPLDWDAAGDLTLLVKVLQHVESLQLDVTLTVSLVALKAGAGAVTRDGPRACLVAVFTSPARFPSVVLDVDHSNLPGGLSGLLLRYHQEVVLADMERQVKLLLDRMVYLSSRWDKTAERALSNYATVKRLPRLARVTKKGGDKKYVRKWAKRLKALLW
ncbi:hypothetical protein HMI48_09740 [Acidithiobacillus ferrooxidans]|uniref:hypothetical protein n=1 Tax=Acidithiobacillus ferrooxidans TaxID=920 RepID=UPI001C0677BA|nr:hypothetical protein [Acidithiobacillus ferrooxidans]MBU2772427.1 hypothetical protein [Acidithiobacillus ferrooxidans]MBU2774163.1 hypothetical protein [Acidithiobacillus ferrooxidans]